MTHRVVAKVTKADADFWKNYMAAKKAMVDVDVLRAQIQTAIEAIQAIDTMALAHSRTGAYELSTSLLKDEPYINPDEPEHYDDLNEPRLWLFPLLCQIQSVQIMVNHDIKDLQKLLESLEIA